MGNIFNDDFRDFIKALNKSEVAYMLVWGYSVIAYGHPRTTGDMDIWVKRTKENYRKLKNAFTMFKMPVFDMTENDFLYHPYWNVFRFGSPPVAIDIMVRVKGMNFKLCYSLSKMINIDGLNIRIINYNNLIEAKKNQEGTRT
jgi:hypothetical protein